MKTICTQLYLDPLYTKLQQHTVIEQGYVDTS